MAATDRTQGPADADAVAAACREAPFLHLLALADGDALAAAGTLAGACAATDTPFHVSAVRTRAELDARRESMDGSALVVGAADPGGRSVGGSAPAAPVAHEAARALGVDPDPALALAGVAASGRDPGEAPSVLERAGLERRAGVAIPVSDPADGLAHTTLAHAGFSGDPGAAGDALDGIDADDGRAVASLAALAAVGDTAANERAATAIESALRPYAGGPLETIGGHADVLCALSRRAPGLGVALALGEDVRAAALDAWREHARAAHAAVRSASAARYDGVVVARIGDGPVETAARLLRDYRSPEPAVLAVADGEAGVAGGERAAERIEAAADRAGGSGLGRGPRGYARFDPDRREAFVEAFLEGP